MDSKIDRLIAVESKIVASRSCGEGKMENCCSIGINFQLYKMNNYRYMLYNIVPLVNYTVL